MNPQKKKKKHTQTLIHHVVYFLTAAQHVDLWKYFTCNKSVLEYRAKTNANRLH